MQYAFVDSNSTVQNLIAYDPSLPYGEVNPPEGCVLRQVNDWVSIGQDADAPHPIPATPTPAQQAAIAIASGVVLTSTGTPSLNGTYPIDTNALMKVNAVETYVLKNNAFPGKTPHLPWLDKSGDMHVFPNATLFDAFATAVADFVASVNIYGDSNGAVGGIPSNQITIP